MAETINSLDEKIKIKANAKLSSDILTAFPVQSTFDENILVDLRGISTVDGKYKVSQLMNAIRGACVASYLSAYVSKDVEDFLVKVENLPKEEKP